MSINDLAKKIHKTAREKGWWNEPRETGTILMLVVSEIAEALEAARNGEPAAHYGEMVPIMPKNFIEGKGLTVLNEDGKQWLMRPWLERTKPEGELVELADAVIRILDYCEYNGWDLEQAMLAKMEYNETRAHRHGGKIF